MELERRLDLALGPARLKLQDRGQGSELALRVVETCHVGEVERRKREWLERIHGHDLVAHGPLSFCPAYSGAVGVS